MNKKIIFGFSLILCILVTSCDWNYSKSPDVPHYEIPEKRGDLEQCVSYIFIITTVSGETYYYDNKPRTGLSNNFYYLINNIAPSGSKKDYSEDVKIIRDCDGSFEFDKKIQNINLLLFNDDQWCKEQEIKPDWSKVEIKEFKEFYREEVEDGVFNNYEEDDVFFNFIKEGDYNVMYESREGWVLYATVNGFLYSMDLDKVREWLETADEEDFINVSIDYTVMEYCEEIGKEKPFNYGIGVQFLRTRKGEYTNSDSRDFSKDCF